MKLNNLLKHKIEYYELNYEAKMITNLKIKIFKCLKLIESYDSKNAQFNEMFHLLWNLLNLALLWIIYSQLLLNAHY